MERRKRSWSAPKTPIGEEKANRSSCQFRFRANLLKTGDMANPNSISKCVFPFTVRAPIAKEALAAEASPIAKEAPASEASSTAKEASSNIASGRISVKSMIPKEKANS